MITKEKIEHHINHLQDQHDQLDRQIKELYDQRANDFKVEELKKKKLYLKDEIEGFKKQL